MSIRDFRVRGTSACRRRSSFRFLCRFASKCVVVGHGEPPLSSLPQVRAYLLEGFTLGVTSGKRGDRGGITADIGFWADNRGKVNGNIHDNGRGRCNGAAHALLLFSYSIAQRA